MAKINHFSELKIWQKARTYALRIFNFTQKEKFSKDFKLKDQINDSAGSIMDNIAEEFTRGGKNEFIQFLTIAMASCAESQSQICRAFDRNYITEPELSEVLTEGRELEKMTTNLIIYLNKSEIKGLKFKDRLA